MVPELAKEVAAQIDGAISPGEIVNADISASAAIALSKLATGALPAAITVASANIVADTIVNADIAPAAAIATTKLADGTEIAALVADATPLAALADDATPLATLADVQTELSALVAADGEILALAALDTELTALANSDLVTAVGAPATYSETGAGLAAALVAAGIMAPS
jgi:hypothetical protein